MAKDRPWYEGPLVAFDTETTSADPLTARLVSAAVIYDEPGLEPFTLEWLVNPDGQYVIPLEATAIHGISTEHAETYGTDAREVITDLLGVLSSADEKRLPVVIMNGVYDLTVLDREYRRYGGAGLGDEALPSLPLVVDPMVLDRMLDPYRPGRRTLTAIAASYGVAIKGAHQATGDCLASLRLARAIIAKYRALRVLSLERLQEVQAEAHARWAANFQEFRRSDDPGFTCPGDWPLIPFTELGGPVNG